MLLMDEEFNFHRLHEWKQGGLRALEKSSVVPSGLGPVCLKKRFTRQFQLIPDDDIEIVDKKVSNSDQNPADSNGTTLSHLVPLGCAETEAGIQNERHPQIKAMHGEKNISSLSPIDPDDRSRAKKLNSNIMRNPDMKQSQSDSYFIDQESKDCSGYVGVPARYAISLKANASEVEVQNKLLTDIHSRKLRGKINLPIGSIERNNETSYSLSVSPCIPDVPTNLQARSLMSVPCVDKPYLAIPISASMNSIRVVDFSFQSLGDEVIVEFAKGLTQQLPLVEEMVLRDNRLTDNGLFSILEAIIKHDAGARSLRKLDLSQNKYGAQSAERLRYHIACENCRLETLRMNQMAISDRDCALLMSAFSSRTSVKALFMSRNEIGQLEHLKMTQPDFHTGGDAIANVLEQNCVLSHLDLSWNYLRLDSSLRLARALRKNKFLECLDVAYNPCGNAGAMMFGEALRSNRALKTLNLSYNSIGYKGARVLATVLRDNDVLENLHLDGNDIRREGGQALMFATCHRRVPTKCRISMNECSLSMFATNSSNDQRPVNFKDNYPSLPTFARSNNILSPASPMTYHEAINESNYPNYTRESSRVFNPQEPTGRYFLAMEDPYERMIAMELLRLATYRKGCQITRLEHTFRNIRTGSTRSSSMEAEGVKKRAINLVFSDFRARQRTALDSRMPVNTKPKKITAEASSAILSDGLHSLFSSIGLNTSGTIEYKAVVSALNKLGLSPSNQDLAKVLQGIKLDRNVDKVDYSAFIFQAIFDFMDTNHSGKIDFNELKRAFKYLGIEHADDKVVREAMSRYDISGDGEMEGTEFIEYMEEKFLEKILASNPSELGRDYSKDASLQLLDASTQAPWQVPEGGSLEIDFLYERQALGDGDEARWSSRIHDDGLSQLADNILLHGSTKEKIDEMLMVSVHDSELQFTASQAYRILEACDGLGQEARKLMMLAMLLPQMLTIKDTRRLVSQTLTSKERCCFKTQMGSLYSVMIGNPTAHYELDLSKSQDRLTLSKIAGIAQSEKVFSRHHSGRSDTSQHGNWENFRNEKLDGKPFVYTSAFVHVMPKRGKLCFDYVSTKRPQRDAVAISDQRFKQLIDILRVGEPFQQNLATSSSTTETQVHPADPPELQKVPEGTKVIIRSMRRSTLSNAGSLLPKHIIPSRLPYHTTESLTKPSDPRSVKPGRGNKPLLAKIKGRAGKRASMPFLNESWTKSLAFFTMSNPTIECIRMKINQIEIAISERWFTCVQAAKIIRCMPREFNARVETIRVLFPHILDIDQFGRRILDQLLSQDEIDQCASQLGWLNIMNPMHPERFYTLDLSVWDEREITKLLVQLAIAEPGENWQNQFFSWTKSEEGIPGWKLPVRWERADDEKEGGVNRSGFLKLEYTADVDRGCSPVPEFRETLLHRVLCGTLSSR